MKKRHDQMSAGSSGSGEVRRKGRRPYSSAQILERRQRILDEAKSLIAEAGPNEFTIRDLGRRAQVSVTTIYKAFGDKEAIIAHALNDFYEGLDIHPPASACDLAGYVRVLAETTADTLQNSAYSKRLTDLYFSRSLAATLYQIVKNLPLQVFTPWIEDAQRQGVLCPGVDIEATKTLFANIEWASLQDWAAGRVAEAQLHRVRQTNFLLLVRAICTDRLAGEAERLLRTLTRAKASAPSARKRAPGGRKKQPA